MTTETVDIRLRTPGIQKTQQELKRVDDELDEVSQSAKSGILPFAALGLVGGFLAGRLGDLAFRSAGLASSFSQISALFEDLGDVIVQYFEPALRSALRWIISFGNTGIGNWFLTTTATVLLFAAALWGLARAGNFFVKFIDSLKNGFRSALTALTEFAGEWDRFIGRLRQLDSVAPDVGAISKGFLILSRAIQSVIGAFANFFDALGDAPWQRALSNLFTDILTAFQRFSQSILRITAKIDIDVTAFFRGFTDALSVHFDNIRNLVDNFINWLSNIEFKPPKIDGGFFSAGALDLSDFRAFISEIEELLDRARKAFTDFQIPEIKFPPLRIPDWIKRLNDLIQSLKGWSASWRIAWNSILDFLGELPAMMRGKINEIADAISERINDIKLGNFVRRVRSWGTDLVNAFEDIRVNIFGKLTDLGNTIRGRIGSINFESVLPRIRTWGNEVVDFFFDLGGRIGRTVSRWTWLDNLLGAVSKLRLAAGPVEAAFEAIVLAGYIAFNGLEEGVKKYFKDWAEHLSLITQAGVEYFALHSPIGQVLQSLENIYNVTVGILDKVFDINAEWLKQQDTTAALRGKIQELEEATKNWIDNAVSYAADEFPRIGEHWDNLWESMKSIAGSAIDAVISKIGGIASAISSALSSISSAADGIAEQFRGIKNLVPKINTTSTSSPSGLSGSATTLVGASSSQSTSTSNSRTNVTVYGDVTGRELVDRVSRLVGTSAPRNYAAGFVG